MTITIPCMTWVPFLWGQLLEVIIQKWRVVAPLPDEIIINILSRLPAEHVLQCRQVCRLWFALTSTPSFVDMHLNRATPLVVVQCDLYPYCGNLCFINQGAKNMLSSMHPNISCNPVLEGSYKGLLLFIATGSTEKIFIIYNPVTQEQVSVTAPGVEFDVCGIFFHQPTMEFRVLYMERAQGVCIGFRILNLKPKSWRKITSFSHPPSCDTLPTIFNGALHWMVSEDMFKSASGNPLRCSESIVLFRMEGEDFRVMPHPGGNCPSGRKHDKMCLLEMEGDLCLCDLSYMRRINIWILTDYVKWVWVKRNVVALDMWDLKQYPYNRKFGNSWVSALYIQNRKLLMEWWCRGLFRYHMELNTFRQNEIEGKRYFEGTAVHTNSLVSLEGSCHIFMHERGRVTSLPCQWRARHAS